MQVRTVESDVTLVATTGQEGQQAADTFIAFCDLRFIEEIDEATVKTRVEVLELVEEAETPHQVLDMIGYPTTGFGLTWSQIAAFSRDHLDLLYKDGRDNMFPLTNGNIARVYFCTQSGKLCATENRMEQKVCVGEKVHRVIIPATN